MILYSYLLSVYVCLLPLIGRYLSGYFETVFFFAPPLFFTIFLLTGHPQKLSFPTYRSAFIQLLLGILFFLSCLLSKNPGISFPQFLIWINSWLIINLLLISQTSEKTFFTTLKITAFVYSLIFLTIKIISLFSRLPISPDSLFETSVPPCQLADYIILALPLFIFFNSQSVLPKVALAFFSLIIITSGSRAAVVSLLIGFEIFNHFHRLNTFSKIRPFLYAGSAIFLAFFFLFPGVLPGKANFGNRQLYADQAIRGFSENPLFGIGPANFLYASLKYGPSSAGATNSAHNSFLGYLSENGIFFTLTFFTLIVICLTKSKSKDSIAFLLIIIAIINSLISATGWTSPSIFIISLFLILKGTYTQQPNTISRLFIITLLFISFITVFISGKNLLSLYYQNVGDYYRSLNYNHSNLESRLQIIRQFHDLLSSDPLFANHYFLFQTLAENTPLPQGESFYNKTLLLNPHGNYDTLRNNLQRYYDSIKNANNNEQHQATKKQLEAANKQMETIKKQREEDRRSKEISDLYTKIASTPFPQSEDYYYQYFNNFPLDDNRAAYYASLLDNYIQTENPPPRVAFLVYIINNDKFENVANVAIVKKNISRQMFILSVNLYLNTNRSGTSLEYIKAAVKLNPTWTAAKIELANNSYWQPQKHNDWDAYKIIYDCISHDPSLFARFRCRQYAGDHFPGNFLKPGNITPSSP